MRTCSPSLLTSRLLAFVITTASKDLKVVSTMSAGYDHVQVSALRSRSIKLGTTPDALTDATADIGAMLTLMATRRAGEAYRNVIEGKWPTMPWSPFLLCGSGLQGVSLRCLSAAKLSVELWADFSPFFRVVVGPFIANTPNQKTIGILGFGRIGQLTLKRLLGFSPTKALYTTSRPGLPPTQDYYSLLPPNLNSAAIEPAATIRNLAERSDILIVTCALTEQTKGLVGAEFLGWMKKGSYVINTARGPIVDNGALVRAVRSGHLAGAGLDVVDGEPNIGHGHELLKEDTIVVLPHIGSATVETRDRMGEDAVRNLFAALGIAKVEGDTDGNGWDGGWRNQVQI
ncbi:BQ5605_C015g07893 [Microbotryum silenes-dioicae]|uniref:BQ5605_C015g07893 protein n=1 Tax=Microbotryum silenes-dioicae TaxID=796604 RepID=A0A2X0LTJ5_9BASI|nr:BQ5605_C015g07893 [Microbotryum silenes-dioicae]